MRTSSAVRLLREQEHDMRAWEHDMRVVNFACRLMNLNGCLMADQMIGVPVILIHYWCMLQ
jgi:hypothetical protein